MVRNLQRKLANASEYQAIMSSTRDVREALKSVSVLAEPAIDLKFSTKKAELDAALLDLNRAKKKFISDLRDENHKKIMDRVKAIVGPASRRDSD